MTGVEGPPLDAGIVGFDGGFRQLDAWGRLEVPPARCVGESWRFRQLDAWGKLEVPPAPNVAGGMTTTVPHLDEAGEKEGRRRKSVWQRHILTRRPSFPLLLSHDGLSVCHSAAAVRRRAEPPSRQCTAKRNLLLARACDSERADSPPRQCR